MVCLDRPFHRAMAGALISALARHGVELSGLIILRQRRSLRRLLRRRTMLDDGGRILSSLLLKSPGSSGLPLGLPGYVRVAGETTVKEQEALFGRFLADHPRRVLVTADLCDPAFLNRLRAMRLDLLLAEGAGLLRPPFLDLFPMGVVNLHGGGPLPEYRGLGSLEFALIDRRPVMMNLHLIDVGIDTGPLLAQQALALSGSEDLPTIYALLMRDSREFIAATVKRVLDGSLIATPKPPGAGRQYFEPHPVVAAYAEKRFHGG
jgi:folate-dependent phosphoribosylglycinamide formyltransferase PurN